MIRHLFPSFVGGAVLVHFAILNVTGKPPSLVSFQLRLQIPFTALGNAQNTGILILPSASISRNIPSPIENPYVRTSPGLVCEVMKPTVWDSEPRAGTKIVVFVKGGDFVAELENGAVVLGVAVREKTREFCNLRILGALAGLRQLDRLLDATIISKGNHGRGELHVTGMRLSVLLAVS
jgi:hypothetical protein